MLWIFFFFCTRNHLLGFQQPILSFKLNTEADSVPMVDKPFSNEKSQRQAFAYLGIFLKKHLFIYFAAPGLRWCTQDVRSSLWHAGWFSCGMQTLNCGMWDLDLWPGIEPWPPTLGVRSLSYWTAWEVTTWNLTSPQILFTSVLCPHAEGDGWVGVKAGTVKWVFCLLNFTLWGGLFKSSFLNRCLLTWLKT